MERNYVPTTSQLIDRLSIVTLKSIKIPENKEEYEREADLIMKDLDLILGENQGKLIRAIQINAIVNEVIWSNESKARAGGSEQDYLLKFTHSVNGVRTSAMNAISSLLGERKDLKVDCIAADICKQNGYDFSGIL
ncbi:MAG: hypothetical protein WC346_00275 [Methanogenium sp.]|jgi:hypothetical protein